MKKWRAEFAENGDEYSGYIDFWAEEAYINKREDGMYSNELIVDGKSFWVDEYFYDVVIIKDEMK